MKLSEELNNLIEKVNNIDNGLSVDKAKEILTKEGELIEEEDIIEPAFLRTMYQDLPFVKFGYTGVIEGDVLRRFILQTCEQLAELMPAGMGRFFEADELSIYVIKHPEFLKEVQKFIELLDEPMDEVIENFEPTFDNCYLIHLK